MENGHKLWFSTPEKLLHICALIRLLTTFAATFPRPGEGFSTPERFLIAPNTLASELTACALSVKSYGFASSPKGRAKCAPRQFLVSPKALATNVTAWLSLRGKTSPAPGEDVAQLQKGESGAGAPERAVPPKGGTSTAPAMTERVGCKNKPSRADKVPERAYKTIFYALTAAHTRICSGAGVSFLLSQSGDTPQRRFCHP